MALRAAKKELRKQIKDRLRDVSSESSKAQSYKALETLFALPQYQNAKRISVYLSMPSGEISTAGIVHDAFKNGKRVFVPYTYKVSKPEADGPTSIMDMVNLEDISDYESLESDKWGIPTPAESSIAERVNSFGTVGKSEGASKFSESEKSGLDLVVMPGMAFDVTLNRLGHGKGFYDFFLMRLKQQAEAKDARMPFLVGLCLEEQLLEKSSVPTATTDWQIDALIVGDGRLITKTDQ